MFLSIKYRKLSGLALGDNTFLISFHPALLKQILPYNPFLIFKSFPLEIPIFLRDHNNGMYNCLTYFLAKIFTDVNYIYFTFWTCLIKITYLKNH